MYSSTIIVLFCVSLSTTHKSRYSSDTQTKLFQVKHSSKILKLSPQMEGGSGQATSSDCGQFLLAFREEIDVMVAHSLRQLMGPTMEDMVARSLRQLMGPIMEDWIRTVVLSPNILQELKEKIQSTREKSSSGGGRSPKTERIVSEERGLCLKFLDEVSCPVLTGKMIEGKEETQIRVALVDMITGQIIEQGPGSSSKVEILVLDAKNDDNEDNWNGEDFKNRIIPEGDKTKPHFAKRNYIGLKEGIGTLCNTKLGHDKDWLKNYKCRLGARMVESFSGIKVQEAWTDPFTVSDSRGKLYEKHYPPLLSDPLWRLENIGKDGLPCKRLNEKGILTVKDFLFLNNTNPQKFKEIVGSGAKMSATLDHAQTCKIDDERMYSYYPLFEPGMGVVMDVVGRLKGAIRDFQYVLENNLSEPERDYACNLLLSAFETRNDIKPLDDENALWLQFLERIPTEPDTLSPVVQSATGLFDENALRLQFPESINWYDSTEPGTSQTIRSTNGPSVDPNEIYHFDALASLTMEQSYQPTLGDLNWSPGLLLSDTNDVLEYPGCDKQISLTSPETNIISESIRAEPHSHQQSNALADIHVQKRQRT